MEDLDFLNTKPAPLSVLLLADKSFMRRCLNPDEYLVKLKQYFVTNKGEDVCLYTPSSMYNLSFDGVKFVDFECQNKTSFVYSLENTINMYDECYIISQQDTSDPYLDGAREIMTAHNKSITGLGYKLK
ncbi:hypothetical protein [Shewanella phage FishSpeaker]|nr:hypothetical protein [Shewanella phage FishSpeaker]